MRSTLYLKFVIVYVIFGFLSIFTVATLIPGGESGCQPVSSRLFFRGT